MEMREWRQRAKRRKLIQEQERIEERLKHERDERESERRGRWEEKWGRESDAEDGTGSKATAPKKDLVAKLKMRYLEHQRDQLTKAIGKTLEKEMAAAVIAGEKVNVSYHHVYYSVIRD